MNCGRISKEPPPPYYAESKKQDAKNIYNMTNIIYNMKFKKDR